MTRIISGLYRNRHLFTPKGDQTRPTASRLRESLFNICQGYIEGARFLDLFAGSGAIGFEALSRGAKQATFIDNNREAILCIQKNATELNVKEQTRILMGNVFHLLKVLEKQGYQFDIIYADPPYNTLDANLNSYSSQVIQIIDKSPLLAPNGTLFVEEDLKSKPPENLCENLKLKSARQMGTSVLQQYEKEITIN
jgi:16S rRNA (guanine966-N2)-methyltransferase